MAMAFLQIDRSAPVGGLPGYDLFDLSFDLSEAEMVPPVLETDTIRLEGISPIDESMEKSLKQLRGSGLLLKRAYAPNGAPLDPYVFEMMLKDNNIIPETWKTREGNLTIGIVFSGANYFGRNEELCAPYFYWGGDKWLWDMWYHDN
jgi:hypothetical protein